MAKIDEFKKLAERIGTDHYIDELNETDGSICRLEAAIAQALREVHNKAVEECASYCESYPFAAELERKCGCISHTEYAKMLRRLKKSNS